MEVEYEDPDLDRLENDASFTGGHDRAVVKAFRKRMQLIRAALDERPFYALKSLHFEKLEGKLKGYRSMRLNDQWRLILKLRRSESGKIIVVVSIDDYH